MGRLRPGGARRKARAARIGEKVQHTGRNRFSRRSPALRRSSGQDALGCGCGRSACRSGCVRHRIRCLSARNPHRSGPARSQRPAVVVDEIPVGGLLREDADVLERGESQPHAQPHPLIDVIHRPARGHFGTETPLAALLAARIAQKGGIGRATPLLLGERPPPDGLRFGTPRNVTPEAFEFLEIARINQFVIPESGCQLFLHKKIFFILPSAEAGSGTYSRRKAPGTAPPAAVPSCRYSPVRTAANRSSRTSRRAP